MNYPKRISEPQRVRRDSRGLEEDLLLLTQREHAAVRESLGRLEAHAEHQGVQIENLAQSQDNMGSRLDGKIQDVLRQIRELREQIQGQDDRREKLCAAHEDRLDVLEHDKTYSSGVNAGRKILWTGLGAAAGALGGIAANWLKRKLLGE